MSDEEITAIILICHPFLLCPGISWPLHGGLSAESVQVSVKGCKSSQNDREGL